MIEVLIWTATLEIRVPLVGSCLEVVHDEKQRIRRRLPRRRRHRRHWAGLICIDHLQVGWGSRKICGYLEGQIVGWFGGFEALVIFWWTWRHRNVRLHCWWEVGVLKCFFVERL